MLACQSSSVIERGRAPLAVITAFSLKEAMVGTSELEDATVKLLQDYAAAAGERLGLQVTVRTGNGNRSVEVQILAQSGGEKVSFNYGHRYSSHDDAVRFIDQMLSRVTRDP
jgi:hypothetical protein